jgi:hypothetical protein
VEHDNRQQTRKLPTPASANISGDDASPITKVFWFFFSKKNKKKHFFLKKEAKTFVHYFQCNGAFFSPHHATLGRPE